MLFDLCAQCQRCCVIDPGHPPLEVSLTRQEETRLGSVCIESRCEHLGDQGCKMGETKPFSCSLYPLSYNPHERRFYFDTECPLLPTYSAQLDDHSSEASQHLASITQEFLRLEAEEPGFLHENHKIDIDYFDLIELPHKNLP